MEDANYDDDNVDGMSITSDGDVEEEGEENVSDNNASDTGDEEESDTASDSEEYTAVTGKCSHCSILSYLRSSTTNPACREEISDLHVLHYSTFLGEKEWCHYRVWKAITEPHNFMSIMIDGMEHLQGIIEHGQGFTMYRSFNNLPANANLNIHCLLLQLESRIKRFGKLPDCIFIQVDGGSEKANKCVLAMCELLIHRRMTKEIFLTRLPVGHTNEDIDAKFGLLWKRVRTEHVRTPQHYSKILKEIYGNSPQSWVSLQDIYAVPDYQAFLEPCIHAKFGNWWKEGNVQHCFRFCHVPCSIDYPMGVQTKFRAYWSDEVYEIVKAAPTVKTQTGYVANRVCSFWGPQEVQIDGRIVCGMNILVELPKEPLYSEFFKETFLTELKHEMTNVNDKHPNRGDVGAVCADYWNKFMDEYPQTHDVARLTTSGVASNSDCISR